MSNASNTEQNNIIYLYGAAWAALIMACIPSISFSIVATALFIFLLIITYVVRSKSEENSFTENHATFITRSLWFGIFILPAFTLTIATIYLLPNYDPSAMNICAGPLSEHILANPNNADMHTLYGFIAPCMSEFMQSNSKTFFISGLIGITPVPLYLLYRFGKGTVFAMKETEITKPKNWII